MKTEQFELSGNKKRDFARAILIDLLPDSVAEERVSALEEYSGTWLGFLMEWVAILLQAYWQLALPAFDKYTNGALAAVVLFSFAAAPARTVPFVMLLGLLLVFTVRDAYLRGRKPRATDAISDVMTTLIYLLAAEAITLEWMPLAMPQAIFFKGLAACMALLPMFRMLSRPLPTPDSNMPLLPGVPPEKVYWRLARLNIAWIFLFFLSINMFAADGFSYIDFFRGAIPGWLFVTWIMLQTNRLIRRNSILQLSTDPRRQRLSRLLETLPQKMKRKDPLYWWYVAVEVVMFSMGTANIGIELWKWLHHDPSSGSWRIGFGLIAFVVCVASWRNIKAATYAGGAQIRAAMDQMHV